MAAAPEVDSDLRALWLEPALLGSRAQVLPGAGERRPVHSALAELPPPPRSLRGPAEQNV